MKFYKLIKSIDYVTSPIYEEVMTIRKEVTKSLKDTKSLILSTIAGVLSSTTAFSNFIKCVISHFVKNENVLKFVSSEGFEVLCPIILFLFVYLVLKIGSTMRLHFRNCFNKNKDTKEKRDVLVDKFYHQIIPQLIEIKSLTEKASTINDQEERKRLLLYLQAKHELKNLLWELEKMQVFERHATGLIKNDSAILVDRIGDMTYNLVLAELLDIINVLFDCFYNCQYSNQLMRELKYLVSSINDASIFQKSNCKNIRNNAAKLHLKITKQYNQKCGKDTLCFSISS